jgi:cob(I)alamin adenosyltransferase
MDLPNISVIKKIEEKLKIIGMELEECATKSDIKHVCDELDKYEKELSKIKSFIVTQSEKNEKNENEISKLKHSFDNVKKTFSSLNKLLENNSLSDLLGNLGDLSKNMVEKEEYDKFIKDIKRKIYDLQMDVDQNNRNLDEIMPLLKKILTADDLDKLQNSLTGLIEKQNADAMGKFANKKEIVKSIKSIESQVKIFMKNLDKEREKEKNESVILASKPVGGYKCASCEAYIGELKDSYSYIPWNKYHGSERPYRLGSSFSRILQGLNIDYTFNPFIHKNLIKNESSKKYYIKNNCSSVKKVKKILPFMHVPSEHEMVKNTTINEQFNMNSTSNNKRYQDSKNLWGNKTAKTSGNDYHWLKNKNKDNGLKSQQIKSVEKMFKVSKKVIKSKINNTSEDMENHYFMPNI